jgi:hypothetical protein
VRSGPRQGLTIEETRFDETAVGNAKVITITEIAPKKDTQLAEQSDRLLALLGLDASVDGCIEAEAFESIYNQRKLLLVGL